MPRWKLGDAEVEALIASGDLQKLTGDAANGERLLEKAARAGSASPEARAGAPACVELMGFESRCVGLRTR